MLTIACKLCRERMNSIFTPEVQAWMKSPDRSSKDLSMLMLGLMQEFPAWEQAESCQRDGRLAPMRVCKDSELEGGECMPICQWEPHTPEPRHHETVEPLAMLLGVHVRIGNDHFTFNFDGHPSSERDQSHFAAPLPFQKVRVIGQGGFGRVWKCQVRFRPSH